MSLTPSIAAVEQSIDGEVLVRVDFYEFGNNRPVASEDFTWTGFPDSRDVLRRDRHGRVRIDGEWVYQSIDGVERTDLDRAETVREQVPDDVWVERIERKIRKHAASIRRGNRATDPTADKLAMLRPRPSSEALRRTRTRLVGRTVT